MTTTTKRQEAAPTAVPTRRGRPPRRVYINVLVKATTREGLTRMKATENLPSQGEVIDMLVAQALAPKPKRSE
ncbi:MAG: hypothetical protein EHM87_09675 [Burkholderiales bacterium]|nr:MAG: hypothetical protein EHM87_09675 [Burkholderiales bacterium]